MFFLCLSSKKLLHTINGSFLMPQKVSFKISSRSISLVRERERKRENEVNEWKILGHRRKIKQNFPFKKIRKIFLINSLLQRLWGCSVVFYSWWDYEKWKLSVPWPKKFTKWVLNHNYLNFFCLVSRIIKPIMVFSSHHSLESLIRKKIIWARIYH